MSLILIVQPLKLQAILFDRLLLQRCLVLSSVQFLAWKCFIFNLTPMRSHARGVVVLRRTNNTLYPSAPFAPKGLAL